MSAATEASFAHVGKAYDGGWIDRGLEQKANNVLLKSALDKFIGQTGLEVLREHNAYDSGFEAGVLAAEAGLGRAEDA